jgi:hypothetical protein
MGNNGERTMTREVSIKMHVYVEVDRELSEAEEQAVVNDMTKYIEAKDGCTVATQVHEHEQQVI